MATGTRASGGSRGCRRRCGVASLCAALVLVAAPAFAAAPPAAVAGLELPEMDEVDRDGNAIEDDLEREVADLRRQAGTTGGSAAATLDRPVTLDLFFASPVTPAQREAFTALGGEITYEFRTLAHGWIGRLPRERVEMLPVLLGPTLVGVFRVRAPQAMLYDATRRGRVRDVWAPGFAGSPLGYEGNANTTIVFLDTGIDDSHPDLAGRRAWWADYTPSALGSPSDREGHGTAVAGVAVGSGAAFGVGPAPLSYTIGLDLFREQAREFLGGGIYLPPTLVTVSRRAVWRGQGLLTVGTKYWPLGTSFETLAAYPEFSPPTTGAAGRAAHRDTFAAEDDYLYSTYVRSTPGIEHVAITTSVSTYGPVGDGYNAFRGVAPGCNWGAGKVFQDRTGTGTPGDPVEDEPGSIEKSLDDVGGFRVQRKVKILNLSYGYAAYPPVRALVNNLARNGILVTVSAGNEGTADNPAIGDPGRAAFALTVGASHSRNGVTNYSSVGPVEAEDIKPDLIAPGGSALRLLLPDSNDGDALSATNNPDFLTLPDQVPDDYRTSSGTSFSAPFAAGAAALVIQALEERGLVWSFRSGEHPLLVKMLLLAGATETNLPKSGFEDRPDMSPTLGRAAAPKDRFEGFGLINVDASVEAVALSLDAAAGGAASGRTAGGLRDRRAWGRRVALRRGVPVELSLNVSAGADFDLYLFGPTGTPNGNPVIVAASTREAVGADEAFQVVPDADGEAYLFVKRVSGRGSWALCADAVDGACACAADCNADRQVTVDDLQKGVAIATGALRITECAVIDGNRDGLVTVDEILLGVGNALDGCPGV